MSEIAVFNKFFILFSQSRGSESERCRRHCVFHEDTQAERTGGVYQTEAHQTRRQVGQEQTFITALCEKTSSRVCMMNSRFLVLSGWMKSFSISWRCTKLWIVSWTRAACPISSSVWRSLPRNIQVCVVFKKLSRSQYCFCLSCWYIGGILGEHKKWSFLLHYIYIIMRLIVYINIVVNIEYLS